MQDFPLLRQPLTVKGLTFRNRVFASPASTNRIALNGCPTAECIDGYELRSRGGFAQVTVNETPVDFEYASRHNQGLDIVSQDLSSYAVQSICTLTEAIRAHGAVASIQLNHSGGANHPEFCHGDAPIGPSAYVRDDGVAVQAMDEAMMNRVADNYAFAARRAQLLGFDMIMLHGGHGWLLGQFLSPRTNKRTDAYGGSVENRARFPMMVLDRIRKAVGDRFVIEYRISAQERVEGGIELEDCIAFCQLIQDKVDMLHVTAGIYTALVETKAFSSMFDPHCCNLELAAAVKKHVRIPVGAVGGFNSPEQIERALAEGKCDYVALGRQQLADPEFVNKILEGRADEISPCLRCSCFNGMPSDPELRGLVGPRSCTVNPASGRELRLRCAPAPRVSKRVLVVGGGVGGMYAAITAAERGHRVTLCEKTGTLGGHLWFTDVDPHKEDLRRYRDSLKARLARCGAEVLMNTEADDAFLEAHPADVILCATGSKPLVPPIKGIERARHALFAYAEPDQIGERVVMIGGGLIGCETGYYLAEQGKKVTVLEMRSDLAVDAFESHRRALLPRLRKTVDARTGVKVLEVTEEGVLFEENGRQVSVSADTVVFATGMRADPETYERLKDKARRVVRIGDCRKPGRVQEAVFDGMTAAMDIL